MVTTTAIVDHGASVNLPRADAGSIGARGVVVTAAADRPLEVNGTPVTLETLASALQAQFERGADRNVILRGDRTLALEQAVKIMTVAKAAGADKIAIATAPESPPPRK
jgi:biopolymer transport protein ExbD